MILLDELDEAKKYSDLANENAGFFDTFAVKFSKYFKKRDFVNNFKASDFTIDTNPKDFLYKWTFNGVGTFDAGKKQRNFNKLELERLLPNVSSGIVSLDKGRSIEAKLYENDMLKYTYNCTDKNSIKLSEDKTIIFKLEKGVYIPYVKTGNTEYKLR